MRFIDRVTLGKQMAQDLSDLMGKEAVIVSLQESSLLTCLTVAAQLRAWVYPLLYAPVYDPADPEGNALGAYDEGMRFCINPDLTIFDIEDFSKEERDAITNQKSAAHISLNQQAAQYGMTIKPRNLEGRDVVLVGDIVLSGLSFAVAASTLRDTPIKSLTTIVGNATQQGAELARMSAEKVIIKDVLTGIIHAPDYYFERPDEYTSDEKYAITKNIISYWQ